jgi:hypothetical protein
MTMKAMLTPTALRALLPALGCALLLGGAAAAADPWAELPAAQRPAAGTPDLNGGWMMQKPPKALKTVDGKDPPLLPAAKAEYARRQAALKTDPNTDPARNCWMHGVPRLLYAPYPVLIAQEKDRVNFVHEVNHTFRVVSLTRALPKPGEEDPAWMGYSSGRWQGKTLVVDTIGFNDKTWLDYSRLPHGKTLKVEERYTLKDSNTLVGTVTITDPETYSAPWNTAFTLVRIPNYQPKEMVCVHDHKM